MNGSLAALTVGYKRREQVYGDGID
jgi:hypothetical protein